MNFFQKVKQALTSTQQTNITNVSSWNNYEPIIPDGELLNQYFGATARAIKRKVDASVSHNPKLYRIDKDGNKEELFDTPLQRDLSHFNSHQSYKEARKLTMIHKSLTGAAFWLMMKSKTPEYNAEFFVLAPNQVTFYTVDEMGFPTAYRYTDHEGRELIIPAEFIIVFKSPSPHSFLRSHSDVQSSRYAHNSYELAMNFNMNFFNNMARPELVFSIPDASNDQMSTFETVFNSKFRGTKSVGKNAFLNREIKIQELTKTLKDMQFQGGIELMREEIYADHGVPKDIITGSGTYENVKEATRIFQTYTVKPELDAEAEVLTEQLIPRYYRGIKIAYKGTAFLADNPIQSDKKAQAETAQLLASTELQKPGTFSVNEIRKAAGFEPRDGGDEYSEQVEGTPPSEKQSLTQAVKKKYNRDKYLRAVDKARDKYEARISALVDKFFRAQEKDILAQLDQMEEPSLSYTFDEVAQSFELSELLYGSYSKILTEFAVLIRTQVGIPQEEELSIDQLAYLQSQLVDLGLYINSTTGKAILDAFVNAIENGLTNDLLAAEIRKIFGMYEGDEALELTRAQTIARTTTTALTGWTAHDIYENSPLVAKREWQAARDKATRKTHAAADGQVVAKGEPFLVGNDRLRYPGDPQGSASEIINCRCIEAPVVG